MARKAEFITLARRKAAELIQVLNEIKSLNREYTANGGASWLADGDFIGENSGIASADFETAFGNMATLDVYVSTQDYDDTIYKIV